MKPENGWRLGRAQGMVGCKAIPLGQEGWESLCLPMVMMTWRPPHPDGHSGPKQAEATQQG